MDKNKGRHPHGTPQVEQTVAQNYTVRLFIPHGGWYTSFGRIRKSLEVVLTVDEYRQLFYHIWNNSMSFLRGRKIESDEVVQNTHVLAVRFVSHYFAVQDPDDPAQWQPLLDALDFEQAVLSPEFELYGFQFEILKTTNPYVLEQFRKIIEYGQEYSNEDIKQLRQGADLSLEQIHQLRTRLGWMQWLNQFSDDAIGTYSLVTFPFSNVTPDLIPINVHTVEAEPFDHTFEGYRYLIETFSPYGLFRIANALARLHQQKHKVDVGAAVEFVHKITGLPAIHGSDLPELYAGDYSSKASHHARKLKKTPSLPMVAAILAHMVWTLLRKCAHRRDK